jgi:phosphate transport system substrate-binding protein
VKLKSPGRSTLKGLAVTGVAIASVAGLALSQTPALADPTVIYAAVGSDTIQDVENAFATSLNGNLLGSYNAVNPVSVLGGEVITPSKAGITTSATPIAGGNCSFTRPNGSGQGVAALRTSLGSTTATAAPGETVTVTGTVQPPANPPVTATVKGALPGILAGANCVDVARSSSGPAASAVDPTNGKLLYLPFALDAVTTATGSTAGTIGHPGGSPAGTEATPATNLTGLASVGFSLAGLQTMYANGNDAFNNSGSGICYAPVGGPDAVPATGTCSSIVPVDLYIPQAGSGTLSFFAGKMGFSATTPPVWDFQTIQSDGGQTVADWVGQLVEEHDGTAVTVDPNGLSPFSIAQYIAQTNGHNDRRHQSVLMPVNGVSPTTAGGTLNTAFVSTLTREVYNVVTYDRVVNTGDGFFDPILNQIYVSTTTPAQTALLCSQRLLIQQFGFALLTTAPLGHTCGQIDTTNLRAFGTTTGF